MPDPESIDLRRRLAERQAGASGPYDQSGLFRTVTEPDNEYNINAEEAEAYREYARTTDPPNLESWYVYHPLCRRVWEERGIHPPQYVIDKHNPPQFGGS